MAARVEGVSRRCEIKVFHDSQGTHKWSALLENINKLM